MSLIHIEESQLCKYWRYWEPLILQFALGKALFFTAPSILPFDLNSSVITLWPADVLFKYFEIFPLIFIKVQIFNIFILLSSRSNKYSFNILSSVEKNPAISGMADKRNSLRAAWVSDQTRAETS